MKVFNTIVKIVVALAAIAGAVYVVATYGEKIVAWCKKMLSNLTYCDCDCGCECCCDGECTCEGDCETCDAEVTVEQIPAEEAPAEEAPVVEEGTPVADEADFEG